MLPTFMVIGAARTGTTWLHSILAQHPEIFVPETKEPDFLNRRILREPWENYRALFRSTDQQKAIRGDMSVNYTILRPYVVERIHRAMPDLRLVITLRHPVDRMWSQLKYDRKFFGYRMTKQAPLLAFLRECESARLCRRNNYRQLIRTWENAFGLGALHVDLFDRIETNPYGYVKDVLWHIGADWTWRPREDLMEMRVNASDFMEMPPVLRWYLSTQWLEPTRQLNDALAGRVTHWVEQMASTAAEVTPSRRLLRHLNRMLLSLPTRLSYDLYDIVRQAAIAREFDKLQGEAVAAEGMNTREKEALITH